MKNTITDLRNHLFELMENLKDPESKVDLARAKVCVDTARVLIDSAKVEVDFLKVIDSADSSEFFNIQRMEARRSLGNGGPPEPKLRRIAG